MIAQTEREEEKRMRIIYIDPYNCRTATPILKLEIMSK